ncbi:MAG: mitochondrial fission ELM1 family protein [Alphaproteobacteria bacterium]|nr:mitochondrial fission ELM1 family protein [Alphaproteobacteria bacterium]
MVALPLVAEAAAAAAANSPLPLVWVLHDGKAGMASQSLGLAEATGLPFIEKRLVVAFPWSHLPPQLWWWPLRGVSVAGRPIAPPWPDMVIACGRNAAIPALAIRRAAAGHTLAVQIQDPRVGRGEFDLLFVPEHDRLRGANVVVTQGALHRVTPARLAAERRRFPQLETLPGPILSVLIGGSNRAYRLTLACLREIGDAVASLLRASGGAALITPSRRTGTEGIQLLRARLAGLPAVVWDGTGDNPYYAYLAMADAFLVTADSVSMISEAAATGRPVHILALDGGDRKFARFHEAMRRAGITRPFAGRLEAWSYPPPDDTERAGAVLRGLVRDRRAHRQPA